MANLKKSDLLKDTIEHFDITKHNTVAMVEAMSKMSFTARDLARASDIYDKMLGDKDCNVILCLAGSLFSAGLKKIVFDLVNNNMVDAIVSTGANIIDQDFFESLGFKHYKGTKWIDDHSLRATRIDRIYDTFIDEDELGDTDAVTSEIAGTLKPRPYSSREFIEEMGKYLVKNCKVKDSVVLASYKKGVPVFVPAFSDCSAGFGLLHHQWHNPEEHVSVDSAKDFLELVRCKLASKETGLLMLGGGVPKNFAQDITVGPEMLGLETKMHKYAIQITVADERDGALSGSTLREACSWGKVDTLHEQMVYAEASLAFPILASYAYHKGNWRSRKARKFNELLNDEKAPLPAALR
ncbi:MAG: deoxyhypusine synthase [Elusimicrobia bacterium]|nr:deoxyhypusine synthase [Elusimicrobiota bacterium]